MKAPLSHLLYKLFIKHLLCARLGARMRQETEERSPRILGESEDDKISIDTCQTVARVVRNTGEGDREQWQGGDFPAGC